MSVEKRRRQVDTVKMLLCVLLLYGNVQLLQKDAALSLAFVLRR